MPPSCAGSPPTRAAPFKSEWPSATDAERACHAGVVKKRSANIGAAQAPRRGRREPARQPRPAPPSWRRRADRAQQRTRPHSAVRTRTLQPLVRGGASVFSPPWQRGSGRQARAIASSLPAPHGHALSAAAKAEGPRSVHKTTPTHLVSYTGGTDLRPRGDARRFFRSACAAPAGADRAMPACAHRRAVFERRFTPARRPRSSRGRRRTAAHLLS